MNGQNLTLCAGKLREALSDRVVEKIATECGFFKRRRKFNPVPALWSFVTGLGSGTANSLADIRRNFCDLTGCPIEYKPFHDRLSNRRFPEFLRQLFETILCSLTDPISRSASPYLKRFEDIVIQDGSSFALNDDLADTYPGRFTKISPAALEVHCTYSVFEGQPNAVGVAPDQVGEREFLPLPEELNGKLLLLDRGYASYAYGAKVKAAGGHYICRAKDRRLNPEILQCYRGEKHRFVGKKLKEVKLPKSNVDLLVRGRSEDNKVFEVRLVIVYVRRKDTHVFLFTSLSPREFPPTIVAALYRLRWQVELFFKECKSYTKLKKFQTKDPHIVEGLVWASMIAIVLRRFLLYSAFRKSGMHSAPFVAASMGWTFFRDLAKCFTRKCRGLAAQLSQILETLRRTAGRTNPTRNDSFAVLLIEPISGYP